MSIRLSMSILALPLLAAAPMLPSSADDIRVMSYNIRYETADDGPNAWPVRRDFLIRTVRTFEPDLLGTQETIATQRDYSKAMLPDFEVFAAGRDDGAEKGEMMALFYRKARFEKLEGGHFWLSETPDVIGSKGWDAALPRMVTWVKLQDRTNPNARPIVAFNTHFDHRGKRARIESARLIRRKIGEIALGCSVILTGDFNSGEGSSPYESLFAKDNDGRVTLVDSFRVANPRRTPEEGTFSGFRANAVEGERIDWIGCSPDFAVKAASIDRTSKDGRTPSDHFPILAILTATLRNTAGERHAKKTLSRQIGVIHAGPDTHLQTAGDGHRCVAIVSNS